MLNGTYYMRQVFFYYVPGQTNDLGETINIQGNLYFSGDGLYAFTGRSSTPPSVPRRQTFTTTGTYTISASGEGYITAVDQQFPNDRITGLVSQGVFIGKQRRQCRGL